MRASRKEDSKREGKGGKGSHLLMRTSSRGSISHECVHGHETLTFLDVPRVQLESELLLELFNVELNARVRSDGRVIAKFYERSEISVVLGELERLVRSTDRD